MAAPLAMAFMWLSTAGSAGGLEPDDVSYEEPGYGEPFHGSGDGLDDTSLAGAGYGGTSYDPVLGDPCDPADHPHWEADPYCNPALGSDAPVPVIVGGTPPPALSFDDGLLDDGPSDEDPRPTAGSRTQLAIDVPLTDLELDQATDVAANRTLLAIDALAELGAFERAIRPEVAALVRETQEVIPSDGLTTPGYVAELEQYADDMVPFLELLEVSGLAVSDDLWSAVDALELVGLDTGALDAGTVAFLRPEPWINAAGDLLVRGGESASATTRTGDAEAIQSALAAFGVIDEAGTTDENVSPATDNPAVDSEPSDNPASARPPTVDEPASSDLPWWPIGAILSLVAVVVIALLRRGQRRSASSWSTDNSEPSCQQDDDRSSVPAGTTTDAASVGGPPSVADLLDASRRMTSSLDVTSIADIALAEACRLVQAEGGIVVRRSDDGLDPVSCEPPMLFNYDHIADGCLPRVVDTGRSTTSIATQEPLLVEVPMAMAAVPIVADGVVGGAILVVRVSARPFARDELDSLEMLAPLVGSAFVAADTHESATELVDVEPLTGLQNRRRLDQDLASIPADGKVAYVMVDIDHFKNFNDTNGHAAGDEALRQVSALLSASVRPRDLVYRYGGEELCVLLPGANAAEAAEVAERARAAVEAAHIPGMENQPHGRVTISVGVSDSAFGTPNDLVERADAALYEAKRNGRNQVSLHRA